MVRSWTGVAVMLVAVMGTSSVAAGEQATTPRVSVTRGADKVTLTARTQTVRVSQTLTPKSFDLVVSDGRDSAQITGDIEGRVTVRRAGQTMTLALRDATLREAEAVRALLRGSTALARLRQLAASPWARSHKDGVVFVSAQAMVAVLEGDQAPIRAVVHQFQTSHEPQIVRVRQRTASDCWRAYEQDALSYTYELEACMAEASYSLNPLRGAWCAYSYNLKASLAFVWLLDCSGY
jgi:hypothetical protein